MEKPLKIIQLNIWLGKLLNNAITFLKEENADIVCLQEVLSWDIEQGIFEHHSTLEKLIKALPYEHVYFEPTLSYDIAGEPVRLGNAILSKLPLEDRQSVFTHGAFAHIKTWQDDAEIKNTRNAQTALVTTHGKQFRIVNHHGYHISNSMGDKNSTIAMGKLAAFLQNFEEEIIFCGDLNVEASSEAMRVFDNWLRDLTAEHNITETLSMFGRVKNIPCDHILVSEGVNVASFTVAEDLVSDHKPLIITATIQK